MGKGSRNRKDRKAQAAKAEAFIREDKPTNKALNQAVAKQAVKLNEVFYENELANILYVLHQSYGFGFSRLLRFVENYRPVINEMEHHYEAQDEDVEWFCARYLREKCGFNVAEIKGNKPYKVSAPDPAVTGIQQKLFNLSLSLTKYAYGLKEKRALLAEIKSVAEALEEDLNKNA